MGFLEARWACVCLLLRSQCLQPLSAFVSFVTFCKFLQSTRTKVRESHKQRALRSPRPELFVAFCIKTSWLNREPLDDALGDEFGSGQFAFVAVENDLRRDLVFLELSQGPERTQLF
jgi:hypothetical protein